jgi:hypothetical protein
VANLIRTMRKNRGVSTVFGTILFMILIMMVASTLFLALYRFNSSTQQAVSVEEDRAKERIVLVPTLLTRNDGTIVTAVRVNNTGTITCQIKAVYINDDFLCDPSLNAILNSDGAYINAQCSKLINITEVAYNPAAKITVATERGVKSIEYESNLVGGQPPSSGAMNSVYGPLRLNYSLFFYEETDKYGKPTGTWQPGWSMTTTPQFCAWNITVTNIDNRNITLNQYSSLTLVTNVGGSQFPWYINSTSLFIATNQTVNIVYIWTTPHGTTAQGLQGLSSPTSKVFLTFYGIFSEGKTYGQTIPFEAVSIS